MYLESGQYWPMAYLARTPPERYPSCEFARLSLGLVKGRARSQAFSSGERSFKLLFAHIYLRGDLRPRFSFVRLQVRVSNIRVKQI